MKNFELTESYPLSKTKSKRGNRRIVREKLLQILHSYRVCGTSLDFVFQHIFYREFNFGDEEEEITRLLRPDEIYEIEADVPIIWTETDLLFGREMVSHIMNDQAEIDKLITEFAENWKLERISPIDRILIEMATVELMRFPEIPPKVSINEAIDLSKVYSSEKSKEFVNGILDSILEKLRAEGKILKTGRGLIDD
jgi:transcription antitermination factor NusB